MSINSRRIRDRIIQRQRRGLETGEERVFRRSLDRERRRIRRHRISQVDIDTVYYLGQMNELCQYCESLRFPNEQRNCRHNGKVSLTQLCEYPESLKELLMVPHKMLLISEITLEIIIVHLHLPHLELM